MTNGPMKITFENIVRMILYGFENYWLKKMYAVVVQNYQNESSIYALGINYYNIEGDW